jgi:hypothetical protein
MRLPPGGSGEGAAPLAHSQRQVRLNGTSDGCRLAAGSCPRGLRRSSPCPAGRRCSSGLLCWGRRQQTCP